ncbi:unnamed protein product [Cuscuta europaea]|uniref:endo-polygalacturonase n=1 Tax=Cuscuta europaea TaxID=41803 RepID=A0A9P1DYU8_CUSEU|nr:unnamed protein product [Cuscuta europaea]
MSMLRNIMFSILWVLIMFLTLAPSCLANLHDDNVTLYDIKYMEEEYGHDFRAYPSYMISPINGSWRGSDNKLRLKGLLSSRNLASPATINVDDYGARGDGEHDDSAAFKKAWKSACSSTARSVSFEVSQDKKYLLKPISFSGPCKSAITFQIYGSIEASDNQSDYKKHQRHWLLFKSVQNLMVEGGGTLDGNGKIWWQNSCKINKALPCKDAPTALTFYKCKRLTVKDLKIQNAQQIHVSFEKCSNVRVSNVVVTAPEASPNTDGIHVTGTKNINLTGCTIRTGDDCISIVSGARNVVATNIACGPGHGISIGSLGAGNSKAYVSNVIVNGAKLSRTTNGVRIKTWQGGSGSASNIKFQNIKMYDVKNPIIIDQNYCDQNKPCKDNKKSNVEVKNVVYENISGTSATEMAIDFDCDKRHSCRGIVLRDVNLKREGGGEAKATCRNVHFNNDIANDNVSPQC